ncbi:hypothetical protein HDU67_007154 [Dinochytrium kinnereticum]|nr:hypothetical protein HDU67_007154 [Dinochytrium kinnereticum]
MKEINVMKSVTGHKNIVDYYDSSVAKSRHGGFEVFILMEYCPGGQLVDLMNTKLQERLDEQEVLAIFSDVCEAVARMHYMPDPILHRDIKVENVLIAKDGTFKLCDFGSASYQKIVPNTSLSAADIRLIDEEVEKLTTLQYRAPELCDLYQKKGMTEKIDIWALGVLLYKLCYFTTPFEESGKLAILNGRFTIPRYPVYSKIMIGLIEAMLEVEPRKRPNIYQVFLQICTMRDVECPLPNKYIASDGENSQKSERQPSSALRTGVESSGSPSTNITPMRRGRPTPKQNASQTNLLFPLSGSLSKSSESLQMEEPQKQELPNVERLKIARNTGDEDPFAAVARTRSIPNIKTSITSETAPTFSSSEMWESTTSVTRQESFQKHNDIPPFLGDSSSSVKAPTSLSTTVGDISARNLAISAQRPRSEGSSLEDMWAFASGQQGIVNADRNPPKPPRRRPPPPPPPKRKAKEGDSAESPNTSAGYVQISDDSPSDLTDPFLDIAKGISSTQRRPMSMYNTIFMCLSEMNLDLSMSPSSLVNQLVENPVNWFLGSIAVYLAISVASTSQSELPPPKHPIVIELRNYTPKELLKYDGVKTDRIFLAVNGRVYDVTAGKGFYGPGGMYGNFAGRDASRGLAKESFDKEMLTDPEGSIDKLEDLMADEWEALKGWAGFFQGKYNHVGFLVEND